MSLIPFLHEIAARRPELHRTLRELALFAGDGRVHHHALTDGLHGGLGHDGHPLSCPGLDGHRDEHAQSEVAAWVRHFDTDLRGSGGRINARVDVGD